MRGGFWHNLLNGFFHQLTQHRWLRVIDFFNGFFLRLFMESFEFFGLSLIFGHRSLMLSGSFLGELFLEILDLVHDVSELLIVKTFFHPKPLRLTQKYLV